VIARDRGYRTERMARNAAKRALKRRDERDAQARIESADRLYQAQHAYACGYHD
jgi:hypothetical protein